MENKFSFRKTSYWVLYYKYRDYLVPVVVVAICLLLLGKVLFPQIETVFSTRAQEEKLQEEIDFLEKNVSVLAQYSGEELDDRFMTASTALPGEKDFAGVLRAISSSASRSNVALEDFTFQVGDLSTKSAVMKTNSKQAYLELELTVEGDVYGGYRFINELTERLPLAEIVSVDISDKDSRIEVIFYYKPFSSLSYRDTMQLRPFSPDETELLSTLLEWKNKDTTPPPIPVVTQEATSSAPLDGIQEQLENTPTPSIVSDSTPASNASVSASF